MGGKLHTSPLRTEAEASAEAGDLFLNIRALQAYEHVGENSAEKFIASHLSYGSGLVPRERHGKRQGDMHEKISLPARVEGVVGENVLEVVAKGGANLVEAMGARQRRGGSG